MTRRSFKLFATGLALGLAFPCALLSGFGRFKPVFTFFAHAFALGPGMVGDYLRLGYYIQTLRSCSWECQICFGAFFAHREVTLGKLVAIGPYSVIGRVVVGDRTKIGALSNVVSGVQQHKRDAEGRLTSEGAVYTEIVIGPDCWIGANCTLAADIGPRATVAAGSVVLTAVPADVVVAGNPARKIVSASVAEERRQRFPAK